MFVGRDRRECWGVEIVADALTQSLKHWCKRSKSVNIAAKR